VVVGEPRSFEEKKLVVVDDEEINSVGGGEFDPPSLQTGSEEEVG